MYYQNLESAPDWQRELAVHQWKIQGLIEPPVMERLAAFTYQLVGQEVLWIPRIYAIIFWVLGGIGLLFLTKELTNINGSIFALVLYFFTPYTVYASRSFQPDPLMVALMIFAIFGLVKWGRTRHWKWAIITGIFSGLAIFIKTVVIFPLGIALLVVPILTLGKSVFKNKQVWTIGLLTILPYFLFFFYGLIISGELQSQFSLRFFPQLWITPEFWLQWNGNISKVIGLEFFLGSILGTFMLDKKIDRLMVIGLFLGYFVYGMVLPYHISTHDYYQLPLIPMVLIGISSLFHCILTKLKSAPWSNVLIVLTVVFYFFLIKAWDIRVDLKRNNYRSEVNAWEEIALLFDQNDAIIGITPDYGYRFEYWGWHKIENWMSSADFSLRELDGQEFDMKSWFEEAIDGKDYFLITQFEELDRQPQVEQLLQENYPVWSSTNDYLIYDLQNPLKK
ncbi:MAG: glycosyltransferase family 39 protein [Anaerolineaceae bacterium]|nr:glycosyltransferase family 39 protein [Anaerolineaceae bacterium]